MIGFKKKQPQDKQEQTSLSEKAKVEDVNQTRLFLNDPMVKVAFKAVLGAYRCRIVKELENSTSDRNTTAAQVKLAFLKQLETMPDDINNELKRFKGGEGSWLVTR